MLRCLRFTRRRLILSSPFSAFFPSRALLRRLDVLSLKIDSVGLPKLAHDFKDVDVNVICHGCLKADRWRYRLTPNYNTNAFEEDSEEDYEYEEETALCGECGEYSSTEYIFYPHCGT